MSEVETIKGKLVVVPRAGKSLNELCEYVCKIKGHGELGYNNSWIEQISEELYQDYMVIDDTLYVFESKEDIDSEGFEIVDKDDDGSINFFVSFYNGGGCLSEVIENAVKKL